MDGKLSLWPTLFIHMFWARKLEIPILTDNYTFLSSRLDSYGWSLDCSWVDITGYPAGEYILMVKVNPGRRFPEASFDNNLARISVTIPDVPLGEVSRPLKLETATLAAGKCDAAPALAPDSSSSGSAVVSGNGVALGAAALWYAMV